MILIGKGLGFQAKVGDPIDGNNIEKRFILKETLISNTF
ncbi:CAT RNA binding domain-containing protein [Aerococcus viridans]|nr:CAT RNA binding domain-containing protein [Aerococcus viridans]